jgi:uncharacterized protein (TIGR03437 family)
VSRFLTMEVFLNRFRFQLGTALLALLISAAAASAQTAANVTVISGNGQLVCGGCLSSANGFFQPMVVKVTDANGAPINGATVNWALTAGTGSLPNTTSTTDANGLATMNFLAGLAGGGTALNPFTQTTIVATSGNGAATFTETQGLQDASGFAVSGPITARPISSNLSTGNVFSGQVGTTSATPLQLQVVSTVYNTPVPNVAVFLVNGIPTENGGTMRCAGQAGAGVDTVLTDKTGVATCNPIFGGAPNVDGHVLLDIGGSYPLEHFTSDPTLPPSFFQNFPGVGFLIVRVTPGTPGALKLVSGNPQTVQAGQPLAAPLVVQVQGTAGQALSGQTITWSITPTNAGTLGTLSSTTDVNGLASTTLQLSGSANGPVQVTAKIAGSTVPPVTFQVTAVPLITVTGLQILSGNSQTAIVSMAFGAPLVVQLNASNGTAVGAPVQFNITGPGVLSATSATTNSAGQAQVNVQATGTPGAVTVTATSSGFSQTFVLTVSPAGPSLTTSSFLNAADFQFGSLSPCSLATIIAPGLAPGLQGMVSGNLFGPLPYLLANDKLTVGGSAAPVFSVGMNPLGQQQLTFQVPCDVTPGSSVPVVVNVGAGSATVNIPILAASPGIFQTQMSDGVTRAVLVRPDGSFVSLQNPARRGENLVAFATGLGLASTPVPTDSVASPGAVVTPRGTVVIGMAGGGIPLVSAQMSDELVGLWMVTFTVPTDAPTGDNVSFSVSVIPAGGSSPISSAPSSIPVR